MADQSNDSVLIPLCITRREFLVRGSLVSIALVLAGCGGSDGLTAPGSVSLTVNIADYPSLAQVAGTAYVTSNNNPLVIVRIDDNTFDTFSRVCPHQGGTINTVGNGFQCPVHGARFSDTGTWVGGQPTSNLTSYATQFDSATGMLTIG